MNDRIFIDEYPVIDRAPDARRDFLAYKEISVGDGGYELGETTDNVQYVDNLDHSADFLNPPYLNENVLMFDPRTNDTFSVNQQALIQTLTKYREKLKEEFEKLGEEFRRTGYITGNRLVKALNDAYGNERPNTLYGDKQGFLLIDEQKVFDYTFTGSDGSIEKMEPTEPVYDISWIRKRMKCCKNPMERKQLEKQLNAAYKARKKARNKR